MNAHKKDFPLFRHYPRLIYFDNAATTQKPATVLDAVNEFYEKHNASVHRGTYALAENATRLYEQARATVARFIGADANELIFTKGATEGINFVAQAWALKHLKQEDEIILSVLEHHANLLPWQHIAQARGVIIKFIPLTPQGLLDIDALPSLITNRTRLISVVHVSNALGTRVDIKKVVAYAKPHGIKVMIDACQSVPHEKLDVHDIGCDFLVFSGHKMLGPTGIGVLYIKSEMQEYIDPYQRGGGMVFEADYSNATWLNAPYKFEAGTPPIAQAIGLAVAVRYLDTMDLAQIRKYQADLCKKVINALVTMPGITVLGPLRQLATEGSLVTFYHRSIHAHDIAAYLDTHSICVRAGNYCAQPLARLLKIDASVRISFYLYNTQEEVDLFIEAMRKLCK